MTTDRELQLSAAALLDDAALVVKRGWCQGSFCRNAEGETIKINSPLATEHCLQGSIYEVGGMASAGMLVRRTAFSAIEHEVQQRVRLVRLALGLGRSPLIEWNDAPGRTQAEVVDAMQRAAARLRDEA